MIKIDFEFQTPHGLFRDALHLEDSHTFSDSEIEDMKQARLNNWIAVVTNPPEDKPEPDYIEIDGVKYVKAV